MRRALATVTAAGLLSIAPVTAAAALEGDGAGSTTTQQDSGQQAGDSGASAPGQGARHPAVRRMAHRVAARAAAEEIGVSVQELRDAVLGGQTVAALAESKGVSVDAVEAAVAAALDEAIDEAVANGKITAEQAARAKEHTDEAADRMVNSLPRRLEGAAQP